MLCFSYSSIIKNTLQHTVKYTQVHLLQNVNFALAFSYLIVYCLCTDSNIVGTI